VSDPKFNPVFAENRKARHDYTVLDTVECGIVLTGTEVKSVRHGEISLAGSYGAVLKDELWLMTPFQMFFQNLRFSSGYKGAIYDKSAQRPRCRRQALRTSFRLVLRSFPFPLRQLRNGNPFLQSIRQFYLSTPKESARILR
jgi:hypothetical protein